jgi:hypothetical protein
MSQAILPRKSARFSRRDFLKVAGATVGGLALSGASTNLASAWPTQNFYYFYHDIHLDARNNPAIWRTVAPLNNPLLRSSQEEIPCGYVGDPNDVIISSSVSFRGRGGLVVNPNGVVSLMAQIQAMLGTSIPPSITADGTLTKFLITPNGPSFPITSAITPACVPDISVISGGSQAQIKYQIPRVSRVSSQFPSAYLRNMVGVSQMPRTGSVDYVIPASAWRCIDAGPFPQLQINLKLPDQFYIGYSPELGFASGKLDRKVFLVDPPKRGPDIDIVKD